MMVAALSSIPMRTLSAKSACGSSAKGVRLRSASIYPQPDARVLRQAIADHHGISVDSVVTHAGDEALRLAVTTFMHKRCRRPQSRHIRCILC